MSADGWSFTLAILTKANPEQLDESCPRKRVLAVGVGPVIRPMSCFAQVCITGTDVHFVDMMGCCESLKLKACAEVCCTLHSSVSGETPCDPYAAKQEAPT